MIYANVIYLYIWAAATVVLLVIVGALLVKVSEKSRLARREHMLRVSENETWREDYRALDKDRRLLMKRLDEAEAKLCDDEDVEDAIESIQRTFQGEHDE